MTEPMDRRAWVHTTVVVVSIILAVLVVLGGTIWFILDDRGLAPPPRAAAEHVERVVRTHAAPSATDAAEPGEEGFTFRVVTVDGESVDRIALELDPQTGSAPIRVTTDKDGIASIEDVRGGLRWQLRTEPEWKLRSSSIVHSTANEIVQTVIVTRTCAGPVRVLDVDGSPFKGRLRGMIGFEGRWLDLDETGTVELERRSCGRNQFRVIDPRGTPDRRTRSFVVDVEGHERVEVQLGDLRHAIVQLVDEDGDPVDISIAPRGRLGVGRFRVEGWRDSYRISIPQSDHITVVFTIPLDGGVHERVLRQPREVDVTLLCDDCPEQVFCGTSISSYGSCSGSAPDYVCTCPAEESILAAVSSSVLGRNRQGPHPLALVHPADTEKVVDVRGGRGSIEATWTGNVPCRAAFAFEDVARPITGECGLDGAVLASDLFPGTWTVSISDGFGVQTRRTVVLQSHENLDLGVLGPGGADTGR